MRFALLLTIITASAATMYDVIMADGVLGNPPACVNGCAVWGDLAGSHNTASQATVNALWHNATLQRLSGSSCAIPANLAVPEGAACYCAGTLAVPVDSWGYCGDPSIPMPQQINLQFGADGEHVQVAFVTLDHGAAQVAAPLVQLCDDTGACVNASGRAALAPEPQNPTRVYSYHFVPLPSPLKAGTAYTYRARGGTAVGSWSPWMRMTTRDPAQPLRFALFGDQGVYPFNNMANLAADRAGGLLDFVVHLGDAAYNLAMQGGARGDGYFYAAEPLFSDAPVIWTIGNHEMEGSPFGSYCNESTFCEGRFLNQTDGYSVAGAASGSGNHYFYSLDVGAVHFAVLDTLPYLDLGPQARAAEQIAWLSGDLARVNRSATPWVIVATHVPMYCSAIDAPPPPQAQGGAAPPPPYAGCIADGISVGDRMRKDLEPLLLAGGVDLFAYGHVHAYESTYPIVNGTVTRRSLVDPTAPVHVLTGAAGPPGSPEDFSQPASFTRRTLSTWSYGRVTVWNASHLTYEHVFNANGSVFDSWTIAQSRHGPFPG